MIAFMLDHPRIRLSPPPLFRNASIEWPRLKADLFEHLHDPAFGKNELVTDPRTWRMISDVVTADELESLFDHLDVRKTGYVQRSLFLHVLHPPSYAVLALERPPDDGGP